MSEIFLVRHGQASFDSDNYDQLSSTGHEQAAILSQYWQGIGVNFDAVYSGSLQRQRETAEGLANCVHAESEILEGLNEYSSAEILNCYREEFAAQDGFDLNGNMRERKYFQRFLESACLRWVRNELSSSDIEPFAHFQERVVDALNQIIDTNKKGRQVVVATSGGVIALAVQSVLNIPDEQAINLNWMVFNTSITRIPFSGSRKSLSVFNAIPHLERQGFTDKITYR